VGYSKSNTSPILKLFLSRLVSVRSRHMRWARRCGDRHRFQTQAEARLAIFEFIEGWYNPHRRHSALGYHSPVNYERSQLP
jgi:transposase InsO family protein